MRVVVCLQKVSNFGEAINHDRIAILIERPFELAGFISKNSSLVHRVRRRQAVSLTGVEVVPSVAWGGVNHASTVFGRDIGRHHRNAGPVEDWVLERHILEVDAFERLHNLRIFPSKLNRQLRHKVLENQVMVDSNLDQGIGEIRMKRTREVRRNRPRRGRPDNRVDIVDAFKKFVGIVK